jgi:Uma2 family endonuclease
MSVMAARELTREDLDALPDDGLRHELIDGAFVMTPAPGLPHQTLAFALARALHTASSGTELRVVMAPFDVILGANVIEPDILVAPRASLTERDLPTAPLLVVEVRSPSTARLDEVRKRSLYEEAGVAHYWLADPAAPSLTVLDLVAERYQQRASVRGDEPLTLNAPFPITIKVSELMKE